MLTLWTPHASGDCLKDHYAWVTRARKGIGQAQAVALARLGATAHLISRTDFTTRDTVTPGKAITSLG